MASKLKEWVLSYGPAIFIIGAVIGTGSVSSLVWAGAEHGMSLLWSLMLSCFFFWLLITSISRLTFAGGMTFVALTKKHFGTAAAAYIVLAIVIGQFTSNIGVLGIVSESFASWTGFDFLWSSIIWSTFVYLLIAFGKYALFEKALIVFVTVLALSFMVNLIMAPPDPGEVLRGLMPSVPEGGAMIAAAMVGTTLAGSVVVMRSFVVKDKGWTLSDLKHADKDAVVTGVMVFIVSAIIMAAASATLHVQGLHIDKAIDMAYSLEPMFGRWAGTLFVTGIMAAGLSSAMTNALVSSWSIADFFGLSRDPQSKIFRILVLPFCLAGLVAALAGGKPVFLQIISLAIQAIFMPLLVVFILLLLNKESVAGKYKNSFAINFLTVLTFLFSLFMAYQAYDGLRVLL